MELPIVDNTWRHFLEQEFCKSYFNNLIMFLEQEYHENTIYPKQEDIFTAFTITPLDKIKVVIIGQDPYHEPNQAHGLAFSVPESQKKLPPSLMNIYKELNHEFMTPVSEKGNLTSWGKQGVFLLNTILTVREGEAFSHRNRGWETFTSNCIQEINKLNRPVVFMLWGKSAQNLLKYLDNKKHMYLCGPHPSPLSAYRGFFGCNHFKACNDFLISNGEKPIEWQIL